MTEYRKTVPPAMKMYQLSRFSFGKATSFAPIIKGIRKLPSTAGIEGARKKKIITRPCRVNILLYVDGSMREPCGSIRIKSRSEERRVGKGGSGEVSVGCKSK